MKPVFLFAQLIAACCIAILPGRALAAVEFVGLDDSLERNARAMVRLVSATCDQPAWRVERLYRYAERELRDALEALGYYSFTVEQELSFADPECWSAKFTIELGSPVVIKDLKVSIMGEAREDRTVLDEIESREPAIGSVLNHGAYETFKRSILTQLGNRGFLAAEIVESTVVVDESLTHAEISIEVDSGRRHRFGALTWTEEILDADILAIYSTFKPGEYYDATAISRMHRELRSSGFFASVSILADPHHDSLEVPVVVTLLPARRHRISAGVGYSTDSGVYGRLGYVSRRLNTAGHRLESELFASPVDSELTATYRWPRVGKRLNWVEAYSGYQIRRTDTSASDKTIIGLRLVRNRTPRWLETPYVDLTYEDYKVAAERNQSTLIVPGVRWEATEGFALRRIERGWRTSIDLRGSHEELLSDVTFAQATLSAKYVRLLGEANRLIVRGDLGTTFAGDVSDLPATFRYFTGGDNSVRGYDFETIGPVNDEGEVIGGTNLTTISIELDRLLFGNWALAVFADTGSAFNDSDVDFKTGVGLGIRWYSPFGPVRLDVAHPLDDDEDYRFHLTLGPDL